MILIPFLFFSILTLYWWRRHECFDICVYMSALYALTSMLAVVIVAAELLGEGGILFDDGNLKLRVAPTLLYCSLIASSLLPFTMIYSKDIKKITINAPLAIDLLSWTLIALSFLNIYLVADSTLEILQGDLAKVRNDAYAGVDSPAALKAETLPFIVKVFYYLNASTLLCIPIFFYNICFRNKAWWFNGLLLFTSLSMPIVGIQQADRTEIVFYGLMFLYCLIFFYRFLSKKDKIRLLILGSPIVLASVVYLVAVSQARFDDNHSSDSDDRAIQYAGQGYLNFCYFYEYGKFDYISTEREFPLINYVFKKQASNSDRRDERAGEQGFFISVFSSFLGDIMLDISPLGLIIWVLSYFIIMMLFIRRSHREEFDISEILFIFLMAVIPIFGIFYYRYFYFTNTLTFLIVIGLLFLSKYKLVLK